MRLAVVAVAISLCDLLQEMLMLDSDQPPAIALQLVSGSPPCLWSYCQHGASSLFDALAQYEGSSISHLYPSRFSITGSVSRLARSIVRRTAAEIPPRPCSGSRSNAGASAAGCCYRTLACLSAWMNPHEAASALPSGRRLIAPDAAYFEHLQRCTLPRT